MGARNTFIIRHHLIYVWIHRLFFASNPHVFLQQPANQCIIIKGMAPSRQADNRNVFLWFQDLASPFTWSVSRPAEVQPWEVRFAHPCRARARHPIHKAMGGHASHGRASDRTSSHFKSVRVQLKYYGRARLHPVCFSIPSGAIRTSFFRAQLDRLKLVSIP